MKDLCFGKLAAGSVGMNWRREELKAGRPQGGYGGSTAKDDADLPYDSGKGEKKKVQEMFSRQN